MIRATIGLTMNREITSIFEAQTEAIITKTVNTYKHQKTFNLSA